VLERDGHDEYACFEGRLKPAITDPATKGDNLEIYRNLLDLSDRKKECSKEQIDTYLSIKEHLEKAEEVSKPLRYFPHQINHCKTYEKIESCADKLKQSSLIKPSELSCVDSVFKRALGIAESSSIKGLLQKLIPFDVSKSDFSARGMLRQAKKCTGSAHSVENEPLTVLGEFMRSLCENIYGKDSAMLNVYNILNLIEIRYNYSQHVVLLLEYHRICTAWSREESRKQFEDNLIKQMGKLIDWIPDGRRHASNYHHTLKLVKKGLEATPRVVNEYIQEKQADRAYREIAATLFSTATLMFREHFRYFP
jgi:hypothetical protein